MDPVFGGLADEILLGASRGRVALDGMAFGAHQIVELGQFEDEGVVVVLEEWLGIQAGGEDGFQMPSRLFLGCQFVEFCQGERRRRTSCFLMIF